MKINKKEKRGVSRGWRCGCWWANPSASWLSGRGPQIPPRFARDLPPHSLSLPPSLPPFLSKTPSLSSSISLVIRNFLVCITHTLSPSIYIAGRFLLHLFVPLHHSLYRYANFAAAVRIPAMWRRDEEEELRFKCYCARKVVGIRILGSAGGNLLLLFLKVSLRI